MDIAIMLKNINKLPKRNLVKSGNSNRNNGMLAIITLANTNVFGEVCFLSFPILFSLILSPILPL